MIANYPVFINFHLIVDTAYHFPTKDRIFFSELKQFVFFFSKLKFLSFSLVAKNDVNIDKRQAPVC